MAGPDVCARGDELVVGARSAGEFVDAHARLLRLHEPDLLGVTFVYLPTDVDLGNPDIERVNEANRWIHDRMLAEGTWHLHQFSVPDDAGAIRRGATLYPLRFMAANPRIELRHMSDVLDYVVSFGCQYEKGQR